MIKNDRVRYLSSESPLRVTWDGGRLACGAFGRAGERRNGLLLRHACIDGLVWASEGVMGKRWLAREPGKSRANKFAHATQPIESALTPH